MVIPFLILFAVPASFAEDENFFSTLFGDAAIDNDNEYVDNDKGNGWFYGYGIVSVDGKGNVYVADMAKHRVQKFSPTGEFLAKWGTPGTGDGQFVLPARIAFDSAGNLFVADAGNNRIQKFTGAGEFLETLDGFGEIGVQQIIYTDIAIDSEDNIYSLDVQSLSIHKISSFGGILAEWELYPDEEEPKITTPHILSIDSDDNVYVADSHRIHVFSSDGKLISKFDTFGTIIDGSTEANPLAIDFSGNTYVRDWDDGTITKFSTDGTKSPSHVFASLTTQEPARFAIGVTLDNEGNLYAFDVLDFNVKKFDSDGNIVASFGERAKEPIDHNKVTYPESMAFDSEDNLYVESEDGIFKFTSDGKAIGKMKLVAGDDGAVAQITDIAFDSSDDMYVSNVQNRIIKFASDGEFIEEYDLSKTSVGEFYLDSMRMSMDGKNNNIYVVGRIASPDNAVQKFSSDGNFIASWNHDHDESERNQPVMIPTAVTADHDENVYVAYYPSLIQKFSSEGNFIAELKSPQREIQFLDITAMAVDSEDNLYVAAVDPHKIIKFSPDMNFIAEWGSTGSDAGQFFSTGGMAVDSEDNVYVADTGNKRIQKFFKDSIVSERDDMSQPDVDASARKDLPQEPSSPPTPSTHIDDSTLNGNRIFDADKCKSLISAEQVKTIANLDSENIFFGMINGDLTELNPGMRSGCAFDFENGDGSIAISFLAAQFISPEDVAQKRDMSLQGAEATGIAMTEGALDGGWRYFTLDINESGLGIMMNSYREDLSITVNVPLVGGKPQPVSEEQLKSMSSVIHGNLGSEESEDSATAQNGMTDNGITSDAMLSSYLFLGQSPLRQIHDGVLPENVTCNEGLELVYKNNNSDFSACVQSDSKTKLIQRGWGILS